MGLNLAYNIESDFGLGVRRQGPGIIEMRELHGFCSI